MEKKLSKKLDEEELINQLSNAILMGKHEKGKDLLYDFMNTRPDGSPGLYGLEEDIELDTDYLPSHLDSGCH